MEIELPCAELRIVLDLQGGGSVYSNLRDRAEGNLRLDAAYHAIESLVLAHACAGVPVKDLRHLEGLRNAIDAVENHFD